MSEPLTHPLYRRLLENQRAAQAAEEEEARRIHKEKLAEGLSYSTARRQRLVEAVERRRTARMAKEQLALAERAVLFPEAERDEPSTGEDPDHGF